MSAPETITLSSLSRGELEALAERLLADHAALKQAIAELRAEVATLKGLQGRPKVKPSGMDQGTEPKPVATGARRGPTGRKAGRPTVHEERVIAAEAPAGSRFKGCLSHREPPLPAAWTSQNRKTRRLRRQIMSLEDAAAAYVRAAEEAFGEFARAA